MKKYIFSFLIPFCTTMVLISCDINNKKQKVIEKTLSEDHSKMNHADMNNIKMTGNFDIDFTNTMMLHHQSAVDMAKKILLFTTNAEIKKVAQNIIIAQEKEITDFKELLKSGMLKITSGIATNNSSLEENMMHMDSKMKAIKPTGNTDKDFLNMMIPHHESAVLMAKDELMNGNNAALKLIAQKIITAQENEIKTFEEVLLRLK